MKKIMFNDHYSLTEAVLQGRKLQTRRIVYIDDSASPRICVAPNKGKIQWQDSTVDMPYLHLLQPQPRYKKGEIVAVAQCYDTIVEELGIHRCFDGCNINTTDIVWSQGFKNKMFVRADLMPHQIRITKVRVERLQDISDEDCLKEGIESVEVYEKVWSEKPLIKYRLRDGIGLLEDTPREAFASLIDKVSGRGTWEINPWVFVYDFELVK